MEASRVGRRRRLRRASHVEVEVSESSWAAWALEKSKPRSSGGKSRVGQRRQLRRGQIRVEVADDVSCRVIRRVLVESHIASDFMPILIIVVIVVIIIIIIVVIITIIIVVVYVAVIAIGGKAMRRASVAS